LKLIYVLTLVLVITGIGPTRASAETPTAASQPAGVAPSAGDYVIDQPLPVDIGADDTNIRRIGRFDDHDPKRLRFAWSASAISVRFTGPALNVRLEDGANRYEVLIDGQNGSVLKTKSGSHLYLLASALPEREHTLTLVRRTEAFFGPAGFKGIQLATGGKLLPVPGAERHIEVIGDSISAGYGNEGANQNEHFSAATENAWLTYGALASRAFDADYVCIAWSGRTLWPKNTIPEVYDRVLPGEPGSKWNVAKNQPQVVVINLGTNDVAKGNPDEEGWVKAYNDFLDHIRTNYPTATIYLAIGPMISDQFSASKSALSTIRRYITRIVKERTDKGDAHIHLLEFKQQTWKNGFGADWHPSLKTHRLMADDLIEAIRHDPGWQPVQNHAQY
jgi:lysophospholipase L1-like esterase